MGRVRGVGFEPWAEAHGGTLKRAPRCSVRFSVQRRTSVRRRRATRSTIDIETVRPQGQPSPGCSRCKPRLSAFHVHLSPNGRKIRAAKRAFRFVQRGDSLHEPCCLSATEARGSNPASDARARVHDSPSRRMRANRRDQESARATKLPPRDPRPAVAATTLDPLGRYQDSDPSKRRPSPPKAYPEVGKDLWGGSRANSTSRIANGLPDRCAAIASGACSKLSAQASQILSGRLARLWAEAHSGTLKRAPQPGMVN